MTSEECEFIQNASTQRHFAAGEYLIREGEKESDLLLVLSGQVEVLMKSPQSGQEVQVRVLGNNATIGDLSFLDGSPRSASVKASEDTDVLILPRQGFLCETPTAKEITRKFHFNIAVMNSSRLKETSVDFVKALQREVDLLKDQVKSGALFVYMILLFGVNGLVLHIISTYFGAYYDFADPVTNQWNTHFVLWAERVISWTGLMAMVLPMIALIRSIEFPIREVLRVDRNLKRSLIEGIGLSAFFAGLALFLSAGPMEVSWVPRLKEFPSWYFCLVIIVPDYFFHSYLQELCTRGIMQNAIQNLLKDEVGHKTVLISSFAFGVMHAHLGVKVIFATMIGSIVFAYLYLRHKNLLGISILHYTIGVIARYFFII
jgi:membrane protease YdiL (CAAX protease family)